MRDGGTLGEGEVYAVGVVESVARMGGGARGGGGGAGREGRGSATRKARSGVCGGRTWGGEWHCGIWMGESAGGGGGGRCGGGVCVQ